jgi:hypothetical protein
MFSLSVYRNVGERSGSFETVKTIIHDNMASDLSWL